MGNLLSSAQQVSSTPADAICSNLEPQGHEDAGTSSAEGAPTVSDTYSENMAVGLAETTEGADGEDVEQSPSQQPPSQQPMDSPTVHERTAMDIVHVSDQPLHIHPGADEFLISGHIVAREALLPLRTLGIGDTCRVTEACFPATGQLFALKSMSKDERFDSAGNVQMTGVTSRTVNTEVLALRALEECPFAVNLVGHTEDADNVHLLMECCQCDLFCVMNEAENRHAALPAGQIQFIMAQIVEVLEVLHQKNFIYRDLKPENVLLGTDGYIKLCDFGSSYKLSSPNDRTDTVTGTPDYMAPEMIQNRSHNRAVDYWALGCLLYDMVCQEPFSDVGSPEDDDVYAAIMKYTKTKKLKWKNGSKKVRVNRCTKSLVEELLKPDPTMRLGMGSNGAQDIRNHGFFAQFDWDSLRSKALAIPVGWCPSPKLCSADVTDEHTDEPPDTALQRVKDEYATLRQQYMRMLTRHAPSCATNGIGRKRASASDPLLDAPRPTSSRRTLTGSDAPATILTNLRTKATKQVVDRPTTPSGHQAAVGLSGEPFNF